MCPWIDESPYITRINTSSYSLSHCVSLDWVAIIIQTATDGSTSEWNESMHVSNTLDSTHLCIPCSIMFINNSTYENPLTMILQCIFAAYCGGTCILWLVLVCIYVSWCVSNKCMYRVGWVGCLLRILHTRIFSRYRSIHYVKYNCLRY